MLIYSAILEIEGHANGGLKDSRRYLNSIADLRQVKIQGHDIIGVITTSSDEPTKVKHFDFNYTCGNNCTHEPASYGVLRYFGLYLVVDVAEGARLFGEYQINSFSRLTVCGYEKPFDGERKELKELAEAK